ncbi:MAG: restriction endonuclease subunit S [Actinomycetota bacterium]
MSIRLKYLVKERDRRGEVSEDVLSVYRDLGVVHKSDRSDNFNKTPEDLSNYKLVVPGDVVVNKMKAWQGSIAVSPYRGIVSGDYLVCEVGRAVEPRYLHYLLRSHPMIGEYRRRSTGIRPSQWRLYWEDFGQIPVDMPDKAVQEAVAVYLDAETSRIDALIIKKRRMIEVQDERWRATMAAGVCGELLGLPPSSPTSIAWLSTKPAGWRRAKLNLIARLGSGHTPSRQHPEWWEDTTIPWITTGEVSQVRDDRREYLTETREKISAIGLANSAAELHPADTVVLCRTASAGYSAIMGMDMATSQDFATWTCGPLLRPRFLLLCLRVMRQDLLGRLAMGSTHKTIYMPDIESIVIPLPSVEIQDAVVEAVYSRLSTRAPTCSRARSTCSLNTVRRSSPPR